MRLTFVIDIKPLKLEFDTKLVFGTKEFNRVVYVRAFFVFLTFFQTMHKHVLLHVFQTNFDAWNTYIDNENEIKSH